MGHEMTNREINGLKIMQMTSTERKELLFRQRHVLGTLDVSPDQFACYIVLSHYWD